jgi:hypothetical protein
MKLNKEWKNLSRDEKRAWRQWAKDNPMLLDSGHARRVSGHKAFTLVLDHRAIAGEPASPPAVPSPISWTPNALNLFDAGPFTTGLGFMGFRTTQALVAPTKWFFWATPPLDDGAPGVLRQMRFIRGFALDAMPSFEVTDSFAPDYVAVHGSFDGPGLDGEWPTPKFIWFRLHQYSGGQLGPGVVLKGQIQIEL